MLLFAKYAFLYHYFVSSLSITKLLVIFQFFLYLLLLATIEKDTHSSKSEINKAPLAYAVAYDLLSIRNTVGPLGAAERN